MIIFNTQEDFLKEFPITDGIINCRNQSFELKFDLSVKANICNAGHINALNIDARNIYARNIDALNIDAGNINAGNIYAWNIHAGNIHAGNIHAWDIKAWDINAGNIDAVNISFLAVCFAYNDILCKSIKGKHECSKYFSLDGKIIIDGVIQELKEI